MIALWVYDYAASHAEGSANSYEEYAVLHWMPRWSTVQTIDPSNYVNERLRVVTASTVRKEASALRTFLAWLVERVYIDEAPIVPSVPKRATGTRYLDGKHAQRRIDLEPWQVCELIEALPRHNKVGAPVRDVVELVWETSLRIGTIERLEAPRHYQVGARRLKLTDDVDKARYGRELPLSPQARAILDEHAREGRIFGRVELRTVLYRAGLAIGLSESDARHVSIHDLRHAALTHLGSTPGVSLAGAAYLAGHKHTSTTAKYVHPGRSAAEEALAARVGMPSPARVTVGAK